MPCKKKYKSRLMSYKKSKSKGWGGVKLNPKP